MPLSQQGVLAWELLVLGLAGIFVGMPVLSFVGAKTLAGYSLLGGILICVPAYLIWCVDNDRVWDVLDRFKERYPDSPVYPYCIGRIDPESAEMM